MRRRYLVLLLSGMLLACGMARTPDAEPSVAAPPPEYFDNITPVSFPCRFDLQPAARTDGAPAYLPGMTAAVGCVLDEEGNPVRGASVNVHSLPRGIGMPGIGNGPSEDGSYVIQLEEPGNYQLVADAEGYAESYTWVRVKRGQTTVLDIVLERQLPATATAIVASQRIVVPTPRPFACGSQTRGTAHPGSAGKYIAIIEEGYSVMGCIKDPSGGGIAGATTVAKPLKPHLSISRTEYRTGADGKYYEPNTYALGWWEITTEAPGYEPSTERVLVKNGLRPVFSVIRVAV